MKDDAKKTPETLEKAKQDIDTLFEDQTLKEQAEEILRYLNSAFPAQTVVPQARVDLLKKSLPLFGDIQKQIDELAAFLLAEFPTEIKEGGAVDNAIRLLKDNKETAKAVSEALDLLEKILIKTLEDKS